jgi:hypothetical protein
MTIGFNRPLPAGEETRIDNPRWEYIFGRQITFRADLQPNTYVEESRFYFHRPEDTGEIMVLANLDDQGVLSYDYDFMRYPLRAFSRVDFRFEVTGSDGEIVRSSPGVFYYEDNRFAWHPPLQSGPFRVHWYEGDETFGQEVLDVAQKGLQQAKNWLPLADPADPNRFVEVNIYVYASAQEMRSTNLLAGTNWVAGHADPDLHLIDVSIAPGPEQKTEMERQIPHELMHILLYQTIGSADSKLPAWLKEGLASINELYPNPYYHTILSQAIARDGLLSFSDICQNFPVDASGAYLAYAQAASFTRYLYDQYGSVGLNTLVANYAGSSALDCQDGTTIALGVPLNQLENSWRQTILGGKSAPNSKNSPWPWVTVLGAVLAAPCIVLVVNVLRRGRRMQSTAH